MSLLIRYGTGRFLWAGPLPWPELCPQPQVRFFTIIILQPTEALVFFITICVLQCNLPTLRTHCGEARAEIRTQGPDHKTTTPPMVRSRKLLISAPGPELRLPVYSLQKQWQESLWFCSSVLCIFSFRP